MDSNNNSANMKLEPGMMCLVIGYTTQPDNLGKIVTLERKVRGTDSDGTPVELWEFSGDNLSWNTRKNTGEIVEKGVGSVSWSLPEHLMPIRPEEDPLEITDVIIKEGESLMKDILILALSVLALLYIGAYTFST